MLRVLIVGNNSPASTLSAFGIRIGLMTGSAIYNSSNGKVIDMEWCYSWMK